MFHLKRVEPSPPPFFLLTMTKAMLYLYCDHVSESKLPDFRANLLDTTKTMTKLAKLHNSITTTTTSFTVRRTTITKTRVLFSQTLSECAVELLANIDHGSAAHNCEEVCKFDGNHFLIMLSCYFPNISKFMLRHWDNARPVDSKVTPDVSFGNSP